MILFQKSTQKQAYGKYKPQQTIVYGVIVDVSKGKEYVG